VIRDWPEFARRGFMLDVSRDRVPTLASLLELVDLLARLRINEFQLYTEHTFAYGDHRAVWEEASPLTPAEIRELDAACAERFIELVPNQNSFGHMERWLRHGDYRKLAECPDAERPACLYPGPESAAFMRGLYDELLPCFTSRRINIGCDETFELGRGRSASAVERSGRGRVYWDFVAELATELQRRTYTVQFWGDIIREDPDLLAELPREQLTALVWGYEAPSSDGPAPGGFEQSLPAFAAAGVAFYACPGTSSWNSLIGRWPNARENLLDAVVAGRRHGASGILITDWGDFGHLQPAPISWPGLVYGAALAWGVDSNRELEMPHALAQAVLGNDRSLAETLLRLGSLYQEIGLGAVNSTALFQGLLRPLERELTTRGSLRANGLQVAREVLDETIRALSSDDLAAREMRQAARLARHGAWRLARRHGLEAPDDRNCRADLLEAIAEQEAVWLLRSRPGGLEDSLARLRRRLDDYAR